MPSDVYFNRKIYIYVSEKKEKPLKNTTSLILI
jgi:hypothetical protein